MASGRLSHWTKPAETETDIVPDIFKARWREISGEVTRISARVHQALGSNS
jgi:hypothetical protein